MTALDLTVQLPRTVGVERARCMVVFDWNGTIVLDADRARDALNVVLVGFGLPVVSAESFGQTFRLPMGSMFTGLGVADARLAEAESGWNAAMSTMNATLRAGTAEALHALADSGTWLGVVSAASAEAVAHDRTSLLVPEVWHAVLAPAEDKVTILRALRHHGDHAVYVGDTAYDMRCAIEAGYLPIGVTGGYAPDEVLLAAGASRLVADLRDLAPVLQNTTSPTGSRSTAEAVRGIGDRAGA